MPRCSPRRRGGGTEACPPPGCVRGWLLCNALCVRHAIRSEWRQTLQTLSLLNAYSEPEGTNPPPPPRALGVGNYPATIPEPTPLPAPFPRPSLESPYSLCQLPSLTAGVNRDPESVMELANLFLPSNFVPDHFARPPPPPPEPGPRGALADHPSGMEDIVTIGADGAHVVHLDPEDGIVQVRGARGGED